MKKLLILLTLLLFGCSTTSDLPYGEYINDSNPEIIIEIEDYGTIKLQLFPPPFFAIYKAGRKPTPYW